MIKSITVELLMLRKRAAAGVLLAIWTGVVPCHTQSDG